MGVLVKKITLTPADIYALNATPQNMLAAPAVGYANNILAITHEMIFNSAAYTNGSLMTYGNTNDNTDYLYIDNNILPAVADYHKPVSKTDAAATVFITTKDFYLTTDLACADGDSDIDVYIAYEVKPIS